MGKRSQSSLLPFSPSVDRWTEEHYWLYTLAEFALGNRKELTPEEKKDVAFAEEVERMAESGEPGWLDKIEEYMSSGEDLNSIEFDDSFLEEIELGLES